MQDALTTEDTDQFHVTGVNTQALRCAVQHTAILLKSDEQ